MKINKQKREPLTKKEVKGFLRMQGIKIIGKKVFCTHESYKVIVFLYPEAKKYFIFQLELDF